MWKPSLLGAIFYSSFITSGAAMGGKEYTGELAARRSGSTRIEHEHKLAVPVERTEEVWSYLARRYGMGGMFLKEIDPRFGAVTADEYFTDIYYDTPSLQVLRDEGGIRYRTRRIPGREDNPKHGRSLLQLKLKRAGEGESRSELKYPIDEQIPAAQRESLSPPQLLKPKHRPGFAQQLRELDIDPDSLRRILKVEQRRRRLYISRASQPFATITLDEIAGSGLWRTVRMTEVELELNEIQYTQSSPAQRREMERVSERMKADLLQRFPWLRVDQTPKYTKVFRRLEDEIPLFGWLVKIL